MAAIIPLLVGAGFYLFRQFSKELNQRMDEELLTEEIQWIRYLRTQARSGTAFILRTPEILIYPVEGPVTEYPIIETTTGYDAKEKRRLPFRQLTHVVPIRGNPYLITIRRSQEQRTVLVANVTRLMLIVFAVLLITTLGVNWLINRTVWRPFRRSLQKIGSVELQKMEAIRFEETDIKEFNELNASLNQMAGKIHNDYLSIKEFTENAAHEMQTPIAVVQSKMELLLQDNNLKEEQVESIVQATTALGRLSKLNQSLLLLAKIENNQFEAAEAISLTSVTEKYLQLLDEIIKDKAITVETSYKEDWLLPLHPLLADTLVSNLLGNAVKYNYPGGRIAVSVRHQKWEISNTSRLPPIDPQHLFKRFYKTKNSGDTSTGLGLAIVKKIADTCRLSVRYDARDGMHHFIIEKK